MTNDLIPVLVEWEAKEHHFAKWNQDVCCPRCGHRGQWDLSHRYRDERNKETWQPYYRYCPECLGVYDLPRDYYRRGDPMPETDGPTGTLDQLLHEQKSVELAAIEKKLLDGGIEGSRQSDPVLTD